MPDGRAAAQAGQAGALVDRELARDVGHLAPPERRCGVLEHVVEGDDRAGAGAVGHEPHQIVPDELPGRPLERAPGLERVQPVPPEQLAPIDVADAGEHRLVHEQLGDGLARARDRAVCLVRVVDLRHRLQRVRSLAAHQAVDLGLVDHLAGHRAAQVGDVSLGEQPQPHLPGRRGLAARRLHRKHEPLPDQPEVDIDRAPLREVDEEQLAVRPGALEGAAVQLRSLRGESPLRTADLRNRAAVGPVERSGQAVQRVSLRHGPMLSRARRTAGRASAFGLQHRATDRIDQHVHVVVPRVGLVEADLDLPGAVVVAVVDLDRGAARLALSGVGPFS